MPARSVSTIRSARGRVELEAPLPDELDRFLAQVKRNVDAEAV